MQLLMQSKQEYASLKSANILQEQFPEAYIIPEGGANEAGIRGAAEIAKLIPAEITDVCVAIGTGTTLSGLHSALPAHVHLHGFYVAQDIERTSQLIKTDDSTPKAAISIHHVDDPRFGKWKEEALHFIRSFYDATNIPLDVVYTSKMMMKMQSLLEEGYFTADSRIICIHTGGLQGNPEGLFS
jgi:1-aminocyclopropane-1-carboxylate deaminase